MILISNASDHVNYTVGHRSSVLISLYDHKHEKEIFKNGTRTCNRVCPGLNCRKGLW